MENAPERCIICGGKHRKPLIRKNSWQVHKCASCGLGVLDPRPSREDLEALYDDNYAESHFSEGGEPGSPRFRKRIGLESHRIRFFRPFKKKGRVLDIGCGYGYFLAACRERGYEVWGIDLSESAARHAGERLDLPVSVGELTDVKLPPSRFDVVTMWHFLEHCTDPKQAILTATGWLKADGILVVDVPNHEGTDAIKTWPEWVGWDLPYHMYHFTPRTLEKLLEVCGFYVTKTKNYHSDAVKTALKRFPIIGLFARLIAKLYSGHSVAVVARLKDQR